MGCPVENKDTAPTAWTPEISLHPLTKNEISSLHQQERANGGEREGALSLEFHLFGGPENSKGRALCLSSQVGLRYQTRPGCPHSSSDFPVARGLATPVAREGLGGAAAEVRSMLWPWRREVSRHPS